MSPPEVPRVVLLAGRGFSAKVIGTALANEFDLVRTIRERGVSRRRLIRGRVRRLGVVAVLDQLVFQTIITSALRLRSRNRRAQILASNGWTSAAVPEPVVDVASANGPEVARLITDASPNVIVVSGTRILGKKLLSKLDVPIVNMHAGLTPRYRGVHGAYWALNERRPDLAGVTIHRVDAGIDTGAILASTRVSFSADDSFVTYPLLQLAAGLPLLMDVVRRLADGERWRLPAEVGSGPLRYHPRASEYLYRRWLSGIR